MFKRAYGLYQERGYRTRLLAGAYRHRLHWTELVGGDVVLTMPHAWQVRFNGSGIEPVERIDVPVEPAIVDELLRRVPDFERAYEPDGLAIDEFESFGATVADPARVRRRVPRPPGRRPRHRAAQPRRSRRLSRWLTQFGSRRHRRSSAGSSHSDPSCSTGATSRLFAGAFAIFGHGNVLGLGTALHDVRDRLPTWRGNAEEGMALAAVGYAKAMDRRQVMIATSSIGPGRPQHGHRRRGRPREPDPGPAPPR